MKKSILNIALFGAALGSLVSQSAQAIDLLPVERKMQATLAEYHQLTRNFLETLRWAAPEVLNHAIAGSFNRTTFIWVSILETVNVNNPNPVSGRETREALDAANGAKLAPVKEMYKEIYRNRLNYSGQAARTFLLRDGYLERLERKFFIENRDIMFNFVVNDLPGRHATENEKLERKTIANSLYNSFSAFILNINVLRALTILAANRDLAAQIQ